MHNFGDVVRVLLNILLVLGLVSVNGFFVAAEFALVKIRETQLDMLVAKGNFRAKVARSIISNLNAYLSATQLGITMASLGLGWAGEPIFTALLSPLLVSLHVDSEALRRSISFAVGFSAWSITMTGTGPRSTFNSSPNCSRIKANSEGSDEPLLSSPAHFRTPK